MTFPVAVFAAGGQASRSDHYWSFDVSHEPGTAFAEGATRVVYSGTVGAIRFDGWFHVVVGGVDPVGVPPAGATICAARRPEWASALPVNQWAPAVPADRLRRMLTRAARRRAATTEQLMAAARPFIDRVADSLRPQLHHRRSYLDLEDVVHEGWRRVIQIIDAFTGPDRPSVPWSTAVYRNCRRDMHRALFALDGTSEAVSTIRVAWRAHPEVTDPVGLQRVMALEAEERRLARRFPNHTDAERHRLTAAAAPSAPFSLRQTSWAMSAPQFVSWPDDRTDDGDRRLRDLAEGNSAAVLAAVEEPAGDVARALCQATGVAPQAILDVITDLGIGGGGDAGAARLPEVRRAVLAPFILDGELGWSEAVLQRAGRRARAKLFDGDDLLEVPSLRAAWRAGISEEEARRVDATA